MARRVSANEGPATKRPAGDGAPAPGSASVNKAKSKRSLKVFSRFKRKSKGSEESRLMSFFQARLTPHYLLNAYNTPGTAFRNLVEKMKIIFKVSHTFNLEERLRNYLGVAATYDLNQAWSETERDQQDAFLAFRDTLPGTKEERAMLLRFYITNDESVLSEGLLKILHDNQRAAASPSAHIVL